MYNNLIIGGVHKAGTTSLFTYLSHHSKICGSKIKETHFFSDSSFEKKYSIYLDYFDCVSEESYYLEASPEYIYGLQGTINRIKSQIQNPKFIFILRDPIDKIQSSFRHRKSRLEFDPNYTFSNFISDNLQVDDLVSIDFSNKYQKELNDGNYIEFLKIWYHEYSDQDIKIIFFDHLKNNPLLVLKDLCAWLKIDDSIYYNFDFFVENKSVKPKFRYLQEFAIKVNMFFESFFRKNIKLKRFIRNIYYKINSDKNNYNTDINSDVSPLINLYNDSNADLAVFLKNKGYTNLPIWLKNDQ